MTKITVKDLSELSAAASKILDLTDGKRVYLLYGEMGVGKTTLIKELCKQLGVVENVSSPTFSIVNEYHSADHRIYHFDFYRLKDEEEAYDLGYEEYFYSEAFCFVEWPDKIADLLPEGAVKLCIASIDSQERLIEIHLPFSS